ncbi:hypothetical protein J5I95_13840 [Candidatus Poribacteria bacterium]|nr:hypothetical protein [Candidatus Poribacteria bacterium]
MIDFRRVKRAKAVFLFNIESGKSIETALVNTAHHFGILVEDIWEWYQDGRFDTLENEVLCPDDEADRQAMNSDIEE